MLKTLDFILTEKGYDVVAVSSGKKGIELIKERFFDIVLTDIKMPEMNGIEVLKKIKGLSPSTSVMMITAYTMHELIGEAKKGGSLEIFPKPLDIDKIISRIEEVKNKNDLPDSDSDMDISSLLNTLSDKEKKLQEKSLLIQELKKELQKIRENPSEMLEKERKKRQSDNIQKLLKSKQLELFTILSHGERTYQELLKETFEKKINIRDMATLRLQISRLDKKLQKETCFRIERIRRNKILYIKIENTNDVI